MRLMFQKHRPVLLIAVCVFIMTGCSTVTLTTSNVDRPVMLGKVLTINGSPEEKFGTDKESFDVDVVAGASSGDGKTISGANKLDTELLKKAEGSQSNLIKIDKIKVFAYGGNLFLAAAFSGSNGTASCRIIEDSRFGQKPVEVVETTVPEKKKKKK